MAGGYHRHPSRRERSLSSITSPNVFERGHHPQHQRSSSAAILDLEYAGLESNAKRRSLSTCAGDAATVSGRGQQTSSELEVATSASSTSTTAMQWSSKPKSGISTSSHVVRFEDKPSKCHHLLSDEVDRGLQSSAVVQRTQSNPEMELCPVCLARKECEILLKRTYSKRGSTYGDTIRKEVLTLFFCARIENFQDLLENF